MARIWLPAESDVALALREPNLLLPGKQPVGPVQIDQTHRLAPDKACFLFRRNLIDLVDNIYASFVGSNYTYATNEGREVLDTSSAGPTDQVNLNKTITFTASDPWTVAFLAKKTGVDTSGMICGDSSESPDFIWCWEGSRLRVRNSAGGDNDFTSITSFEDAYHQITITSDGGGSSNCTMIAYVDGSPIQTLTSKTGSLEIKQILDGFSSNGYQYLGYLEYIYIYGRELTATDVVQLNKNYTQFLKPANDSPLIIGTAAGGGVTITPALISSTGSLSGTAQMSVLHSATAISSTGTLTGTAQLSVEQVATAISAAGSLAGTAQLSVEQVATAISAAGSLAGTAQLSVEQVATAISAAGSLAGTAEIGSGVFIVADPVSATGTLSATAQITVDITATVIDATGTILGTVEATSPGNVLIAPALISASGSLNGSPVIDVDQVAAAISATGSLQGQGSAGITVQAEVLSATGSLSATPVIGVEISPALISATGDSTGQVVQHVLQAAAAISAAGSVSGVAQIVGPGQLGVITQPGIISKTPLYAVISATPRKSVTH